MIKALIIIVLVAILGSLGSALFHLINDKGNSKRMVNALTVRISLSILLFILLIVGYYSGVIEPNVSPTAR